ncbi:MAG: hypothetical protein AAB289_08885, partial [Chloroflexota bacterium]
MARRHLIRLAFTLAALVLSGCAFVEPNSTTSTPAGPEPAAPTVTPKATAGATAITPGPRSPRQGRRASSNRGRNARFGVVQASGEVASASLTVRFTVREAPELKFPGLVDSNSPAFWDGESLVVFNSAFYPVRATGSNLEELKLEEPVVCIDCRRGGGRWLEAVWQEPETRTLYGWYHLEPDDLPCLTAPVIG